MDNNLNIKTKIITIRVSEKFFKFLKKESESRNISVGELFREKFSDGDTISSKLERIEKRLEEVLGGFSSGV